MMNYIVALLTILFGLQRAGEIPSVELAFEIVDNFGQQEAGAPCKNAKKEETDTCTQRTHRVMRGPALVHPST